LFVPGFTFGVFAEEKEKKQIINNVDGEKKKKDEKRMELELDYSFINN